MNTSHVGGWRTALPFIIMLGLSACSTVPDHQTEGDKSNVTVAEAKEDTGPIDPLEWFNRKMWTFNWEYADPYFMRPLAVAYSQYLPQPVRSGLFNMAINLREPSTTVNNILQGKFHDATVSTSRFVLNTTVGLLGFFDPAKSLGLEHKRETFGETLGVYGVGNGPFVMLPLIGPSALREEVGDWVDRGYWPYSELNIWFTIARVMVVGLDRRAQLIEQEQLIHDSFDSYEFVKNAYFQNIEYQLYDGNPPSVIDEQQEADIDALLDEEFEDEF